MDFGSQVGREDRAKIDQKSIPKGIPKIIKKRVRLGRFWVGGSKGGDGRRRPDPPNFLHFQRNPNHPKHRITKQTPKRTPLTRLRACAVADLTPGSPGGGRLGYSTSSQGPPGGFHGSPRALPWAPRALPGPPGGPWVPKGPKRVPKDYKKVPKDLKGSQKGPP